MNSVIKTTTVLFINGLGLDSDISIIKKNLTTYRHIDFKPITLSGFKQGNQEIPDISMEKHSKELLDQINEVIYEYQNLNNNNNNWKIILWGFSYGSDILAYTLKHHIDKLPVTHLTAIFNDPNVSEESCTISKHLAKNVDDRNKGLASYLNSLATGLVNDEITPSHLGEILTYLGTISKKNIKNLARLSNDIVKNAQNIPKWIVEIEEKMTNRTHVYFSDKNMRDSFCINGGLKQHLGFSWLQVITEKKGHFYLNSDDHQIGILNKFK